MIQWNIHNLFNSYFFTLAELLANTNNPWPEKKGKQVRNSGPAHIESITIHRWETGRSHYHDTYVRHQELNGTNHVVFGKHITIEKVWVLLRSSKSRFIILRCVSRIMAQLNVCNHFLKCLMARPCSRQRCWNCPRWCTLGVDPLKSNT